MIGSARDDRQFRRGVVLGLTMAEALLLLIFLLMLILAIKLKGQSAEIARLEQERTEAQSTLAALQPILDKLPQKQKFDITQDYVRMKQQLDRANARLKDAQLSVDLINQAAAALPDEKPEDAAKALIDQAIIGRQALDAAKKIAPDVPPEQAVQALLDAAMIGRAVSKESDSPQQLLASAAACRSDLQSCQNQTVYLNSRLNAKTGGYDLPPCWVDRNGKIQYIFDASLQDQGIEVEDKGVAGREADQAKLPLGRVHYDRPMSRSEFAESFQPLLDWSNQHGCRFYVRLYDDMKTADRSEYKNLRGTVEGYFRILLSY
ncbi:MAG TPA: hypothetical protein VHA35_07050 [Dongiaceae bacterium]|nr:hypothetical protein [Dongiaceae bacterium]